MTSEGSQARLRRAMAVLGIHALRSNPSQDDVVDLYVVTRHDASEIKVALHRAPVNLYVAWYDSQQSGRSAHSPSTCLPGGGWEMKEFGQVDVPGVAVEGRQLRVNRALIAMGPNRQLVYYWFQQRGRVLTNEYLVKWYLFWDALTRRRTDGALVRLTAPLVEGQDVTEADRELADFARETAPRLRAYIPD